MRPFVFERADSPALQFFLAAAGQADWDEEAQLLAGCNDAH